LEFNRLGIVDPPLAATSVSNSFATVARPTAVAKSSKSLTFGALATTWDSSVVVSGQPPDLTVAVPAPTAKTAVKVHMSGGQTLTTLYDPTMTVKFALSLISMSSVNSYFFEFLPQGEF